MTADANFEEVTTACAKAMSYTVRGGMQSGGLPVNDGKSPVFKFNPLSVYHDAADLALRRGVNVTWYSDSVRAHSIDQHAAVRANFSDHQGNKEKAYCFAVGQVVFQSMQANKGLSPSSQPSSEMLIAPGGGLPTEGLYVPAANQASMAIVKWQGRWLDQSDDQEGWSDWRDIDAGQGMETWVKRCTEKPQFYEIRPLYALLSPVKVQPGTFGGAIGYATPSPNI